MSDISNTYANAFNTRKYGYALWFPDMPPNGIHMGDVGFIDQGAFTRLFNAAAADATVDRLPTSFIPTQIDTRLISRMRGAIPPGPVFSPGIDFEKETPKDSEAVYHFTCKDHIGGLLILPEGADKITMAITQQMSQYIMKSHASWFAFAKDELGLTLTVSDLIFVRGYTRADQWTVAAFESPDKKENVSGKFSLSGELLGYQLETGKQNRARLEWRSARSPHRSADGPESASDNTNTVFLDYYMVTPRSWWMGKKIKAGAGYHDLGGRRDDSTPPTISTPRTSHLYDTPDGHLDSLVDYIFTNSEADIAMVSTEDVEALLSDYNWPADLRLCLEENRPRINVNDDKGGTISLVDTVRRLRRHAINKMSSHNVFTYPQNPKGDPLAEAKVLFGAEVRKDCCTDWPHVRLADSTKRTSVVATSVSADAKLLVAAYTDRCVRVWRISDGQLMQRWYGHGDAIQCVAVAPYAPLRVASGSADAAVIIWDLSSCKAVAQLDGHITAIVSLVYSPDGQTLVSGSLDGTVKLWRVRSGHKLIHTMGGGSALADGGAQLAFAPDGARVVSTMGDVGRVWDAHSGTLLASLRGHTAPIRCMALSSDGGRVVTGSQDGTCRVWDTADGRELAVTDRAWPVTSMALSPDDEQIVVSSGGVVAAYAMDDGRALRRFVGPAPAPGVPPPVDSQSQCVACCPYSAFVASGAADGSVRLWNKESGALVGEYRGHEGAVRSVLFSGDGRDLYSSSDDGSLRIWSVTDVLRLLP